MVWELVNFAPFMAHPSQETANSIAEQYQALLQRVVPDDCRIYVKIRYDITSILADIKATYPYQKKYVISGAVKRLEGDLNSTGAFLHALEENLWLMLEGYNNTPVQLELPSITPW